VVFGSSAKNLKCLVEILGNAKCILGRMYFANSHFWSRSKNPKFFFGFWLVILIFTKVNGIRPTSALIASTTRIFNFFSSFFC
jgi:hypothetical protein